MLKKVDALENRILKIKSMAEKSSFFSLKIDLEAEDLRIGMQISERNQGP